MPELRDLYDVNSNKTDKTYYKGEVIPEGYYPMVVMVVIRNSKGEFLMQKRVKSKGGDWGVTGGHPKSGETPLQGIITEVKEEIGLDIKPEDLVLYYGGRSESSRVFFDDYYVKLDVDDIDKLKLQEEEVESLHWFSAEEIHELMKEGKFFKNHYEEFEELEKWDGYNK